MTIVDLGIQNTQSVVNAFDALGARSVVIREPSGLADAEFAVLPGVGAFGAAAERLKVSGLGAAIRAHALERRRPLIGMCLGMQLLADSSEEHGLHKGLGLIPAKVVRLAEELPEWRVPNVGWREVEFQTSEIWNATALNQRSYYHVHSYHMYCDDPRHVVGTSIFGHQNIACVVRRDNIVGTQFHPEKSQEAGLDLLDALWRRLR